MWAQIDWCYWCPYPRRQAVVEPTQLGQYLVIWKRDLNFQAPGLAWHLVDTQEHLLLQFRRAGNDIAPLVADALIGEQLLRRKKRENALE